jgi:hypothetical protein
LKDVDAIQIFINENELPTNTELDDKERQLLEDRINRLEQFTTIAGSFAVQLRQYLKNIKSPSRRAGRQNIKN